MTYLIGLVYAENDTKLSGPIRPCANDDKTRQDNDVIHHIGLVYTEINIEQLGPLFKRVRSMIKTRENSNITDCIGGVYVKNETELS